MGLPMRREAKLFIIRGLPGSGKSTAGERLTPGYVYSADDYFTDDDGNYIFDRNNLDEAHKDCQERVGDCMGTCGEDISVANTFTQFWEVKPYLDLADEHGYNVFIIVCTNDFGSTHDVPDEAVARMDARWEDFTCVDRKTIDPKILH